MGDIITKMICMYCGSEIIIDYEKKEENVICLNCGSVFLIEDV